MADKVDDFRAGYDHKQNTSIISEETDQYSEDSDSDDLSSSDETTTTVTERRAVKADYKVLYEESQQKIACLTEKFQKTITQVITSNDVLQELYDGLLKLKRSNEAEQQVEIDGYKNTVVDKVQEILSLKEEIKELNGGMSARLTSSSYNNTNDAEPVYTSGCTPKECIQDENKYKLECSVCIRLVHYRCSLLHTYQVQHFMTKNYRRYICPNCTEIQDYISENFQINMHQDQCTTLEANTPTTRTWDSNEEILLEKEKVEEELATATKTRNSTRDCWTLKPFWTKRPRSI